MNTSRMVPEPAERGVWERALLAGSLSPNARLVGLVLAVRSGAGGYVRHFSGALLSAVANLPMPEVHQALSELRAAHRLVISPERQDGMIQAYLAIPMPAASRGPAQPPFPATGGDRGV